MVKNWEAALRKGDLEEVLILLDKGISINAKDQHGQTALMIASTKGHTGIVKLLVQRGADLNITAKYHLSALMLAVINNHLEIVRTLAEAGADIGIRGAGAPGFWNKTALQLAEAAGHKEITLILERYAVASPNSENGADHEE